MSFLGKDLGFVKIRDQELSIALFKSVKLQLIRKLELIHIFLKPNLKSRIEKSMHA